MVSLCMNIFAKAFKAVSASSSEAAYVDVLKPNQDLYHDLNSRKNLQDSASQTESTNVNSIANNWGENIEWMIMDDAKKKSRAEKKPLMHIVHKPSCLYCKHMRKQFAFCPEIEVLTHYFVMVNENALDSHQYDHLDSRDFPHIRFYHPDGNFMSEIMCHPSAQFKHSYVNFDSLVTSMLRVLLTLESDRRHEMISNLEF